MIASTTPPDARAIFRRGLAALLGKPFGQRVQPGEALVLLTLADEAGPSTTGAIAQVLGVSKPRASNVLRGLIQDGLVTQGRRGVLAEHSLTDAGMAWVARFDAVLRGEEA